MAATRRPLCESHRLWLQSSGAVFLKDRPLWVSSAVCLCAASRWRINHPIVHQPDRKWDNWTGETKHQWTAFDSSRLLQLQHLRNNVWKMFFNTIKNNISKIWIHSTNLDFHHLTPFHHDFSVICDNWRISNENQIMQISFCTKSNF